MTQPGEIAAATWQANQAAAAGNGAAHMLSEGTDALMLPHSSAVETGFFTWEFTSGQVICDTVTYRMHGLPEDTSATMDMLLAKVPDSELASVRSVIERMMASAGNYQIEYRILGEDGNLRSMEARGRVVPGPDGRPARMMGLVTDITAARAQREVDERRLFEIADRNRRTQDFTTALASAVTVEAIIDAARDGLRGYGANCFILIASRDGRLQEVASYGLGSESVVALSGLASARRTPISDAIKWRTPVHLGVPAALLQEYPHLADILDQSAQRAWVALPVPDARGKVGACLFGFAEPHEFAPEDHAMLYAASGLLAQSVERAHMYESQRALAAELQRGMLPHGALAAPGLSVATKYQPAISGLEIGGDFYDLIRLPDGQVALVIGDVEGHNLVAASVMGQLRIAVHAYAREGHCAAEVMSRTNQFLANTNADREVELSATCCIVMLNPATGDLTMCRAGHPPPVLFEPGDEPRILDSDPGLPLGIFADASYSSIQLKAKPGSLLALMTDGLLATDAGDDYNLGYLLDVLRYGASENLDDLANELLSNPREPPRHGDDVALLLARLDLLSPTGLSAPA
jgi:hypothetical protein